MNRADLETAIGAACAVIGQNEVLVIGSQAILASFDFEQLPEQATMSAEADIAPFRDIADALSTRLAVQLGQDSDFDMEHGFWVDGVSLETAYFPERWRERLIRVEVPGGAAVGLCLEPHDLCATKLARNEQKDRTFVLELVRRGLVDARLVRNRFDSIDDTRLEPARARVARLFIKTLEDEQRRRSN